MGKLLVLANQSSSELKEYMIRDKMEETMFADIDF